MGKVLESLRDKRGYCFHVVKTSVSLRACGKIPPREEGC